MLDMFVYSVINCFALSEQLFLFRCVMCGQPLGAYWLSVRWRESWVTYPVKMD